MKKIIVLTMLVLLAIGMPVLAGDVTFGGDFTVEVGSNFKEGFTEGATGTLDVSAAVDDYNTVSYEVDVDQGFGATIDGNLIDDLALKTDLGAALGLTDFGIGVVVKSGLLDGGNEDFYDVTGYGVNDVGDISPIYNGGAEVVITIVDMVNIELGSDFDGAAKAWLAGAFGTVGPVSAEVYYACEGESLADGSLEIDGVFSGEFGPVALDVGAGFLYELAGDEDAGTREWAYGVGVAASADVGVALSGGVGVAGTSQEDHILDAVGIDLGVAPLEDLGIDVGIYLNTYTKATGDETPMLDHLDMSLYKNFGAAEYRVGYLYAGEAVDYLVDRDTSLNAPMSAIGIDGGGFYMVVDINY